MKTMSKDQYISEITEILKRCNVEKVFWFILKTLQNLEASGEFGREVKA